MTKFAGNQIADYQIQAIRAMLLRGLSDLEIASKLNEMNQPNLAKPESEWEPGNISKIRKDFRLDDTTPKTISKSSHISTRTRYKLVNELSFGSIFLQLVMWIILIIVTFGLAIPFFVYYFTLLMINTTEVHEII